MVPVLVVLCAPVAGQIHLMSLQRLRRVLNAVFSVRLDSSTDIIRLVQQQILKRENAALAKGKRPSQTKMPAIVPTLANRVTMDVRPIDLLRKIGDLTTPPNANMASLSASWATRRYFWAIQEPQGTRPKFRLSDDARGMDFHQKTLLSDEFGIGFGGLVLERVFQTDEAIEVSAALTDPSLKITKAGKAQPDYLMWNEIADGPLYVVECKGCQTSRNATLNQIRRGLEQVPSLVFEIGNRQVTSLVVATLMQPSGTTIYVVDPPGPPDEERQDEPRTGNPSYDRSSNRWRINDRELFLDYVWSAKRAKLLNWAGQFASANDIRRRTAPGERMDDLPNLDLTRRRIRDVTYAGRTVPLFPELGFNKLRAFTGVQEDILEQARNQPRSARQQEVSRRFRGFFIQRPEEADKSIGLDGTCFTIDGL